jgi:hypothetical protein
LINCEGNEGGKTMTKSTEEMQECLISIRENVDKLLEKKVLDRDYNYANYQPFNEMLETRKTINRLMKEMKELDGILSTLLILINRFISKELEITARLG